MARGEVRYRLALETKAFSDGIRQAKQEAAALGNDLAGKLGKAGSVLQAMGPAGMVAAAGIGAATVAVTAVTAAVVSAAKAAAEYSDNLIALQAKTGLSTDALQKMEIAAKLGNTSIEALASATNKMQRGIVDGNENFRKLGLSLSELKKQTPEAQLQSVAVAIEKIQNPAQKTAAAIAIFGKSGADSLGALKALADGSAQLGGALDSGAIKASADMADKLDLMGTAMERAWHQFGAAIAGSPEVQQAIEDITDAFVDLATWIQKHSPEIKAVFGIIAEGAKEAIRMVRELVGWFGKMSPGLGALGGMLGGNVQGWFDDKLKAARQGTGVSSGGVQVGRKVNGKFVEDTQFTGAADDKAAAKAAENAAKVREAWAKAQLEISKIPARERQQALESSGKLLQIEIAAAANRVEVRQQEQDALEAEEDRRIAEEDARGEMIANRRKLEHEDYLLLIEDVRDLGGAFQDLGQVVGGVFGKVLSGLGQIADGIGAAMGSIDKMKNSGGGFQGMLGKASGALGLAGAAFSVGKVVFGAIRGLFGGKSAEEKAAEEQKIKDTISQLTSLMEKAKAMKMEMLTKSVSGLGNMFGYLANQTGVSSERLERLGRFGTDLLKRLRAEGMSTVEAFKAMGPALDKALEAWAKSGREMSGAFANVLEFRQKVLDNQDLVGATEGFNDLVGGMPLNSDNVKDVTAELNSLYDDLIGKGFTADQALQLLAPTLMRIRDAARDGKIAIDEETQALITQAEQGGHFEGLKDPMQELVETQKMMLELWAAIAQMQGVTLPESLRAYLAEIRNARAEIGSIPTVPGGAPAGKYEDPDTGPSGSTQSASGFWNPNMPHGPLAGGGTNLVVHPGEEVSVNPRGRKANMGPVVLNVDGREFARVNVGLQRSNRGGARSGNRRYAG